MATSPAVVEPAKALAAQLFSRIGVELQWGKRWYVSRTDAGCPERAVTIELLICSAEQSDHGRFVPGALGYARPHASSGVQIYVFYDRVLEHPRNLHISVLGYVFAHEIAHVLEGECRHSQDGVMKANWHGADFPQMAVRQLSFASEDVALIRAGLAKRLAPVSATLAIASKATVQPIR